MYKVFAALQCDANYLYQDELSKPESDMLPSEERTMLRLFRQLNEEGKEKLTDYADDLVQSGKYIKSSEIQMDRKEA